MEQISRDEYFRWYTKNELITMIINLKNENEHLKRSRASLKGVLIREKRKNMPTDYSTTKVA